MLFFASCKLLDLKSILPDISIASLALFGLRFTGSVFFYSFTFNLFVSLILKWVSYRQYIVGPRTFSLLPSCLLTGELNLLTFEVITGKEGLISVIVLFVFYKFFYLSFPAFLFSVNFFCGEMFKFLSHYLLCIFFSYFLCNYHGDYI